MSDIKNQIRLMPVKDLLGMNFFIPGYQRGYRWKTRQVEDLLDDIYKFMKSEAPGKYCLQPLVVKASTSNDKLLDKLNNALKDGNENDLQIAYQVLNNHQRWDVVDGQQRLTTIYILLSYLYETEAPYILQYETRDGSQNFLKNIRNPQNTNDSPKATDNIDYWHMHNTYQVIESWFGEKTNQKTQEKQKAKIKNGQNTTGHPEDTIKENFKECLLERTEFIWYETEEDPIEVFTRLNIGKISLTNAELVKALFLNKANYGDQYTASLQQNEIALEWDRIEYTLQKNEFWNFIHNNEYNQPTRIDLILDLVVKLKNKKNDWEVEEKLIGTDEYKTFRYFYQLFDRVNKNETNKDDKKNVISSHKDIWNEIKKTFDLFVEWYNDLEFYHYIGFLIVCSERKKKNFNFEKCFNVWYNGRAKKYDTNKTGFVKYLKDKIKEAIKITIKKDKLNDNTVTNWENLVFDQEDGPAKTACFPLLLLFNVQTIINRNLHFKTDPKFNSTDFQRFPFHLFKNEKGWDIEHIAPNTENELVNKDERKAWLSSAKYGADVTKINDWLKTEKNVQSDNWESNDDLVGNLFDELRDKLEEGNLKVGDERNKIWNFCLLDQSTNRSYGNSIFASKRKEILLRDQGLDQDGKPSGERVFILECTKNVFTKSYSTDVNDLRAWGEKDAENYQECIKTTLEGFELYNLLEQ